MRRTVLVLSLLAVFMFASVPFAAAEWKMNLVTNNTPEDVYVIRATWKAADSTKDIPAGFWTRGPYRINPGKTRIFYSWSSNSIYFRISNADGAIKPEGSTSTSPFWVHPGRSFRVVSAAFDGSVGVDQLLYSDRSSDQLVHSDGFVQCAGGCQVTVTSDWVPLNGSPATFTTDELTGGDSGNDADTVPEWTENIIKNGTESDVYVVRSTWKEANTDLGIPEGFRTRGRYRIRPGKARVFHSWADNGIYFRISNADGAIKPESSTSTFPFWVHPGRSFRVVSAAFDASVAADQLLYSDRSQGRLVHSDGFMLCASGCQLIVTSDWVSVSSRNNEGNDNSETPLSPLQLEESTQQSPEQTQRTAQQLTSTEGMVLIPAGSFQMGSTTGDADESPVHTVTLDAFYMDVDPVTNAEYVEFLNAMGKHADDAGNKWCVLDNDDSSYLFPCAHSQLVLVDGVYSAKDGCANCPVVRVSWYGAMAYAKWVGKRLPTEAEWEYAGRGGLSGKKYPWGDTIDSSRANYGSPASTESGTYPANGYGLYDMAGNVWEWCLDAYDMEFYTSSPAQNPLSGADSIQSLVDTYTAVDPTTLRVLRGGSYLYSTAETVRVSNREYIMPISTGQDLGFRCVRSVPK